MKTLNNELANVILSEYALTIKEMLNVRGGDGDPIINPPDPPIKI
ncbi:MAG TPA: hypothetical protein VJ963_08255 [Bacteroidales bacterium]|nr:hypothetical protein [Bacteroidales bacterium]